MSIRTRNNTIPWAALLYALLGLVWCGYIAFPTANPAPCATSGCALFRDSRIAGISLWWIGGAYFFLLAVVCLRGNLYLARLMAMAALFLDSLLLMVMLFTAPCFDCLVVAVFLGLTYYRLHSASEGWFVARQAPSILLPVWFGLFLGNAALAANEQLPLYSMGNTRSSAVRIFFSPSCAACRAAILASGNAAALYPVEENSADRDSIIRLGALLKINVPLREALPRSINPDEPVPHLPFYERMLLSVRLMRNSAAVLRQGFRSLPLIQINGMADGAAAAAQESRQPQEGRQTSEGPVYRLTPAQAAVPDSATGRNPSAGDAYSPMLTGPDSGQPGSGQTRTDPSTGDSDRAGLGGLTDFLPQSAEELSSCSRASGRSCD